MLRRPADFYRANQGRWISSSRESDLPDQDGTRVEKVESQALDVLLRLRARLGGDGGDIAAGFGGGGEARGEERGLDAVPAVGGDGGGAAELGDVA